MAVASIDRSCRAHFGMVGVVATRVSCTFSLCSFHSVDFVFAGIFIAFHASRIDQFYFNSCLKNLRAVGSCCDNDSCAGACNADDALTLRNGVSTLCRRKSAATLDFIRKFNDFICDLFPLRFILLHRPLIFVFSQCAHNLRTVAGRFAARSAVC